MARRELARQDSWKHQPLPEATAELDFRRTYTSQEYAYIQRGLIPEEMEDKWFIYVEDDIGYFHRSWTGYCVYQVLFRPTGESVAVEKALVNRDEREYRSTDNQRDARLLGFLIDRLLLGRKASFPSSKKLDSKESRAIEQWSMVGRAKPGSSTEEE